MLKHSGLEGSYGGIAKARGKKAALETQIKAVTLVKADKKIEAATVQELQERLDMYRKEVG